MLWSIVAGQSAITNSHAQVWDASDNESVVIFDNDFDELQDGEEIYHGTQPVFADTDGDGEAPPAGDADADADGDTPTPTPFGG